MSERRHPTVNHEETGIPTAEELRAALDAADAEQTQLKLLFENAREADEYKDEIPLSDETKEAITIKENNNYTLFVFHKPSGLYGRIPMTMPKATGRAVEAWIESIKPVTPK